MPLSKTPNSLFGTGSTQEKSRNDRTNPDSDVNHQQKQTHFLFEAKRDKYYTTLKKYLEINCVHLLVIFYRFSQLKSLQ